MQSGGFYTMAPFLASAVFAPIGGWLSDKLSAQFETDWPVCYRLCQPDTDGDIRLSWSNNHKCVYSDPVSVTWCRLAVYERVCVLGDND